MRAGNSKNLVSSTSCFSAVTIFPFERLDVDCARAAETREESSPAAHLKEYAHHASSLAASVTALLSTTTGRAEPYSAELVGPSPSRHGPCTSFRGTELKEESWFEARWEYGSAPWRLR